MKKNLKLTNIRKVGRYKRPGRNPDVNVFAGEVVGKNFERLFFVSRGNKRIFIDDDIFYKLWTRVGDSKYYPCPVFGHLKDKNQRG